MPNFTAFTYQNGWTDYNNGYRTGGFFKKGDRVYLRGVIVPPSNTSLSPSVIATLPAGFRSAETEVYAVFGFNTPSNQGESVQGLLLIIDTDGNLNFYFSGSFSGAAITLDGLSFSILA